jgi:hypothetical protein
MKSGFDDILRGMRWLSLPLLLLCVFPTARADVLTLGAGEWSGPRSGAALARHAPLKRLIADFERQPEGIILLRHGSGDESLLWAEEMRSWLVALGVPSPRIRLQAVTGRPDGLTLEVRAHGSGL